MLFCNSNIRHKQKKCTSFIDEYGKNTAIGFDFFFQVNSSKYF